MMISFWDSFEDIKGFAGEDISQARLYPDDEAFLIRYDARVTHYDLVDFTREQA